MIACTGAGAGEEAGAVTGEGAKPESESWPGGAEGVVRICVFVNVVCLYGRLLFYITQKILSNNN